MSQLPIFNPRNPITNHVSHFRQLSFLNDIRHWFQSFILCSSWPINIFIALFALMLFPFTRPKSDVQSLYVQKHFKFGYMGRQLGRYIGAAIQKTQCLS